MSSSEDRDSSSARTGLPTFVSETLKMENHPGTPESVAEKNESKHKKVQNFTSQSEKSEVDAYFHISAQINIDKPKSMWEQQDSDSEDDSKVIINSKVTRQTDSNLQDAERAMYLMSKESSEKLSENQLATVRETFGCQIQRSADGDFGIATLSIRGKSDAIRKSMLVLETIILENMSGGKASERYEKQHFISVDEVVERALRHQKQAILKEFSRKFNVRASILLHNPVVLVIGVPKALAQFVLALRKHLHKPSPNVVEHVQIDRFQIGQFIGRNGRNLRKICDDTGTNIFHRKNGLFEISGQKESVRKAKLALLEISTTTRCSPSSRSTSSHDSGGQGKRQRADSPIDEDRRKRRCYEAANNGTTTSQLLERRRYDSPGRHHQGSTCRNRSPSRSHKDHLNSHHYFSSGHNDREHRRGSDNRMESRGHHHSSSSRDHDEKRSYRQSTECHHSRNEKKERFATPLKDKHHEEERGDGRSLKIRRGNENNRSHRN